MKIASMGSSISWIWPSKESVSLNMSIDFLNWMESKKSEQNGTEYPRTVRWLQKVWHTCSENTGERRKRKRSRRNIWSNHWWDFPKLVTDTKL